MAVDPNPLQNEEGAILIANQSEHIQLYNAQGRVMAAAGDIYRAGKEADGTHLEKLKQAYRNHWLLTSTQYTLGGLITDYFGSRVVQPQEREAVIPAHFQVDLGEVLSRPHGVIFFQELLETHDGPEALQRGLARLGGDGAIKVLTFDFDGRRANLERVVGFKTYEGHLFIYGVNAACQGRSCEFK